jgi:hypothetical protein
MTRSFVSQRLKPSHAADCTRRRFTFASSGLPAVDHLAFNPNQSFLDVVADGSANLVVARTTMALPVLLPCSSGYSSELCELHLRDEALL